MKTFAATSIIGATITAVSCSQPPGDPRNTGRQAPPPGDPFFELFDTDQNGEISMAEIDAAADILKKRDTDGSGALTRDELPRPPRPGDRNRGERNTRNNGQRDNGRRPPIDEENHNNVPASAPNGSVYFRGGLQTDRRDRGRPVSLIGGALGVTPDIFRDAFSNVTPSRGGDPSPALAHRNKDVLMRALGKHGITNERLDEVSNYYRHRPEAGERWPHTRAAAKAIMTDGEITGFQITNAGSGYATAPTVIVVGHQEIQVIATIAFSPEFHKNGRITSLKIAD